MVRSPNSFGNSVDYLPGSPLTNANRMASGQNLQTAPDDVTASVSTSPPSQRSPASGDIFFTTPPVLSLPKGGGAIRSIGEKFSANPVTGTGSMSIPLAISPGRGGFGPELALGYDSGAG